MKTYAVVKSGGKQYVVNEGMELVVDRLDAKEKDVVELETLATFTEKGDVTLGTPVLEKKTKAEVVSHEKGEKIRVAHFKAKVRYRKVKGFRPFLSVLKIGKIV